MKKAYITLCLGILNACYSLGTFFSSINVEADEWGVNYKASSTSIIWFISSVLIIFLGYYMYKENKTKEIK